MGAYGGDSFVGGSKVVARKGPCGIEVDFIVWPFQFSSCALAFIDLLS